MKTLYISDLDGTLFEPTGKLSERTVEILNRLIEGGMNFTFATARTIYSAKPLTEALHINVPCILNNGASVYDLILGEYLKNAYISTDTAKELVRAFHENGIYCFVYKFVDGKLCTCYDHADNEVMQAYIAERRGKFEQPFIQCGDVLDCLDGTQIYINSTGDREKLLPVKNRAAELENADYAFMFSQADVKIAVENAHPDVKEAADIIIGSNASDGIAEYLLHTLRKE